MNWWWWGVGITMTIKQDSNSPMAAGNKKNATREAFKEAAKNAPKDAVRVRDVEAVIKEFGAGFKNGSAYLNKQKSKLTDKQQTVLIDGTALIAGYQSAVASIGKTIQDTARALNETFTNALSGVDWERVNIETEAYSTLRSYLDAAINDPKIQQSENLLNLTKYIKSEIGNTGIGENEEQFRSMVGMKVAKRLKSEAASKNAKSKNQVARDFVIKKWNEHIAVPSKSKNKKAFAAKMLVEVIKKFEIKKLNASTIERDWLPKNKPRKPT
jgi:hypothetical protein